MLHTLTYTSYSARRASEVTLGAPWKCSADIWNLRLMVWLGNQRLVMQN